MPFVMASLIDVEDIYFLFMIVQFDFVTKVY